MVCDMSLVAPKGPTPVSVELIQAVRALSVPYFAFVVIKRSLVLEHRVRSLLESMRTAIWRAAFVYPEPITVLIISLGSHYYGGVVLRSLIPWACATTVALEPSFTDYHPGPHMAAAPGDTNAVAHADRTACAAVGQVWYVTRKCQVGMGRLATKEARRLESV